MKKLKLTLLLAVLATAATRISAQVCCPQPPPGYDCVPDYPALLVTTNATPAPYVWFLQPTDMYVWETHVTEAVRWLQPAKSNIVYEIQYKHSLADTNWYAYSRVTLAYDDWLTTFHPIYTCEFSRFFRIMQQTNNPAPVLTAQVRTNKTVWCSQPFDPTKLP